MRALLGGKGAGLAEMTTIGLPVPDGFIITTQACRDFLGAGGTWPDGLRDQIAEHLASLEERIGKRLGDPSDPLLVSVRSGSPVSMPGMMDTILNLGLNDRSVQGLTSRSGDERFALDSYRRFVQMFGDVVMGVDGHLFEDALDRAKLDRGVRADVDLDAADLRRLLDTFRGIYRAGTGDDFPQDPAEQLGRSVEAVFRSWNTPRAITYRRHDNIPDDLGTAVNVGQMVFGNLGPTSATGVAFTRNPSTGERELYGEFLVNAQGEDVVAGIRTPRPLAELEEVSPQAFAPAARRDAAARVALQGDAGRRVHDRAGPALHPADAHGQAHRPGGRAGGARPGRGEGARPPLGDRPHRPRAARPAAAPRHRSGRRVRRARDGPERLAGRGRRQGGFRRRHGGGARARRRGGHPRALGDDARRHPRRDPGAGGRDRPRRHDVARRGRGAGDGQAVRLRRRVAADRSGRAPLHRERHHDLGGRRDLGRRRPRARDPGRGHARAAADQRGLPRDHGLGGRDPPAGRRGQRRHARGRDPGARVRRRGHRPVPHRAHVLRRRPPAGDAPDDPGVRRDRPPSGARPAAAVPAVRLRGHPEGDGGLSRSRSGCSTRRCTSSCPRSRRSARGRSGWPPG